VNLEEFAHKHQFWIGAKGGLLDQKHVRKMGSSVWLFLYLLRNQTALNQVGEGVVNYGHPLPLKQVTADLRGTPARTLRRWVARLRREGYIRTEVHGHGGLTVWIAKGKDKTKKTRLSRSMSRRIRLSLRVPNRPRRNYLACLKWQRSHTLRVLSGPRRILRKPCKVL
jgi:hypothetical protein